MVKPNSVAISSSVGARCRRCSAAGDRGLNLLGTLALLARRPIQAAQAVENRTADFVFGVGFELYVVAGIEAIDGGDQAQRAGGDQVVQIHALWQPLVDSARDQAGLAADVPESSVRGLRRRSAGSGIALMARRWLLRCALGPHAAAVPNLGFRPAPLSEPSRASDPPVAAARSSGMRWPRKGRRWVCPIRTLWLRMRTKSLGFIQPREKQFVRLETSHTARPPVSSRVVRIEAGSTRCVSIPAIERWTCARLVIHLVAGEAGRVDQD